MFSPMQLTSDAAVVHPAAECTKNFKDVVLQHSLAKLVPMLYRLDAARRLTHPQKMLEHNNPKLKLLARNPA